MQGELITVPQAASILGLSAKGVWRWIQHGLVPSVRIHGTRRIKRSDLDQLISDGRTEAGTLPKLCKRNSGPRKAGPGRKRRVPVPTQSACDALVTSAFVPIAWVTGTAARALLDAKK
jgi:excisionase family DNA binding protein